MAKIKDLLAYLLLNYPSPEDLSKTRMTKLIYLCDWRHCLTTGNQITKIKWIFDNFGPFVWDVMNEVEADPELFETFQTTNTFGSSKLLIKLRNRNYTPQLAAKEVGTAEFVIQGTSNLSMDAFIKLIYSTYPILTAERGDELDLAKLAREYKNSAVYKRNRTELA
jgi:hypothetical protein